MEFQASNVTLGFDLGHDLDLEFSRSNIELGISWPKIVRFSRNEKHTYQMDSSREIGAFDFDLGHGLDLQIWKVKHRTWHISAKNGPIVTKRNANILIELQPANVTI